MAALNKAFRGVPTPTDVLAFPAVDRPPASSSAPYLGDVAISVETARRQAARRGHPVECESALLLIHGILHLMGHDHRTPAQRRRMERLQARLLHAHAAPLWRAARPATSRPREDIPR